MECWWAMTRKLNFQPKSIGGWIPPNLWFLFIEFTYLGVGIYGKPKTVLNDYVSFKKLKNLCVD